MGNPLLRAILALGLGALLACGPARGPEVAPQPPPLQPPPPQVVRPTHPPKIAIALGGGAARGFAHIGVLRTLENENIKPDLIVGTSVGSLIGGLYAFHGSSNTLEVLSNEIDRDALFDPALLTALVEQRGIYRGERMLTYMRQKTNWANIEWLRTPFAAVATDLNTGQRVVIDSGPLAEAVRSSASLPGLLPPFNHQGHNFIDGGMVDNVPVDVAWEKGADIVISVDIGVDITNPKVEKIPEVMMQSIAIWMKTIGNLQRAQPTVKVQPDTRGVGMLDFTQKRLLIERGMAAMQAAMPKLRQAIQQYWDGTLPPPVR